MGGRIATRAIDVPEKGGLSALLAAGRVHGSAPDVLTRAHPNKHMTDAVSSAIVHQGAPALGLGPDYFDAVDMYPGVLVSCSRSGLAGVTAVSDAGGVT